MPRPLLLIVDGESLKTPGLAATLDVEGWEVRWTGRDEALHLLDWGLSPDLVLLDAKTSGRGGFEVARRFRDRRPDLPVLLVADASDGGLQVPLPIQGTLDRALASTALAEKLRPYRPKKAGQPMTSEELFGDLLADIERVPPDPKAKAATPSPFQTVPATKLADLVGTALTAEPWSPEQGRQVPRPEPMPKTAAALPPPPQKPLETEDIFGDMLADLEGPGAPPPSSPFAAPTPSRPAPPPAPAPRAAEPKPVPKPAPAPAAASEDDEYTLSGISGIHDPFEQGEERIEIVGFETPEPTGTAPLTKIAPRGGFPETDEMPPGSLEEFGNYYLLEKIAVGGMAELFKAKQRGVHNFQKIVAIKRILPHLSDNDEFVTMFIDEAKLAAQLTHPNIVQIFDLGKASNAYYIAMEFVDGRDLRSLLRKVREYRIPVPEAIAAVVAMKMAGALDYAHRKKGLNDKELRLVHRDISPQNILISYEGAVKLVDFGIAKAATKNTQTMAGALKGKLLYMSPEQALGQPLDGRSDIYSLGLVLFELLTGERCFQADSELGVLEKVRMGRISDVQTVNPMVSKEMAAVVSKALQKSVETRYSSARIVERDLKELLVKRGNEPTDHDVAEYVNTVLKGTKEQLEELLASRFAVRPPAPTSAIPAPKTAPAKVPAALEDPPTTAAPRRAVASIPTTPDFPLLPEPAPRSRWIAPVLGLLALLVGALLWWALVITHA